MSEQESSSFLKGISEEKLLGLLLLSLGLLLFLVLLLWRSLDEQGEKELLPVAESKRSVWFDKDGPIRSQSDDSVALPDSKELTQAAMTDNPKATQSVESIVVNPVDIDKPAEKDGGPDYLVQLGTFSQLENADSLAKKVAPMASQVEVVPLVRGQRTLYSVRVPLQGKRSEANWLSEKIAKEFHLKPLVITAGQ